MSLPTEPIGSIPRPLRLLDAIGRVDGTDPSHDALYDQAVRNTIARFEPTGSPVVTDGEQRKFHNFLTYCVHGLPNMGEDGFRIHFAAGHTRRMPRLTKGPFRYGHHAESYLKAAQRDAHVPVKQAVISPSALSLLYPVELPGYPRKQVIQDLLHEHETEVRNCLDKGAHKVQIPLDRLGTTDDCGFSPFCDDRSTTRDTAFAKIRARVEGTLLAARVLGVAA